MPFNVVKVNLKKSYLIFKTLILGISIQYFFNSKYKTFMSHLCHITVTIKLLFFTNKRIYKSSFLAQCVGNHYAWKTRRVDCV